MNDLHIIVLAAGKGKRMRSRLPKVLQPVAGKPMLGHVLDAASQLAPAGIHVVYGHGGDQVQATFAGQALHWVHQAEQRGTGHAVAQALPTVPDQGRLLVLYGDTPLVDPEALKALLLPAQEALAVLTVELADPTGYGRIQRENGRFVAIIEQADANAAQRAINEVNTGIMAGPTALFKRFLAEGEQANAQGEWYLTDIVAAAVASGQEVATASSSDPDSLRGANDRAQLADLERLCQRRLASKLLEAGVSMADPARFDLRGRLKCGQDVWIDSNVVVEGNCRLGDGCQIGPFVRLKNVDLAAGTVVESHSSLEGVHTSGACQIGPFARLRPGTELAEGARIGNFVETKNARFGEHSKANHLSYIGDAELGTAVNIGAGTITCNYDGANKHRTVIGDRAFIGSGSQLVAPVTVGAGATVGAGTTLTRTAPDGELTVARSRQVTVPGWKRPQKTAPK